MAAADRSSPDTAPRRQRHLYRYLSLANDERVDWARRLVVEHQLYFLRPSELNDPFDCQIRFSFDGDLEEIRAYWQRYVERRQINNGQAGVDRMVHLSGTSEGRKELEAMLLRSADALTGIACFSETPLSTQMWSYYADGHRGVVVRFSMDGRRIETSGRTLPVVFPVSYQRDYPVVNYYADTDTRTLQLVSTKADGWSHESEWRALIHQHGYVAIEPGMVDGIALGLRTSSDHEQLIRDWIAKSNQPIELLRVRPMQRSFALEVGPA